MFIEQTNKAVSVTELIALLCQRLENDDKYLEHIEAIFTCPCTEFTGTTPVCELITSEYPGHIFIHEIISGTVYTTRFRLSCVNDTNVWNVIKEDAFGNTLEFTVPFYYPQTVS